MIVDGDLFPLINLKTMTKYSHYRDCQILNLSTKTWLEGPKMINYTADRESIKERNHFYIIGGSYPSNPGPGPTVWKEHDIVQV